MADRYEMTVVGGMFFVLALVVWWTVSAANECEEKRCTPPNKPRFTRSGCFCVEEPR